MNRIPGLHESECLVRVENFGIIKQYTDSYFKLTALRSYRPAGWEDETPRVKIKRESDENRERLPESVSRARSRIFEIAMCNEWEYFVTLTLDAQKQDRYDLEAYKKRLGQWIGDYKRRKGADVRYLLIPEEHKDGAWHIHGLIAGLPEEHMTLFTLTDKITSYMRKKIRRGAKLYNWSAYADAFGWVSMEKIKDTSACAKYMCKYITKQVAKANIKANDHLYYCTQRLKRAEVVHKGILMQDFIPEYWPDNNYVKTRVFPSFEDAVIYFTNCECLEDGTYRELPDEELKPVKWLDMEPDYQPPRHVPVYTAWYDGLPDWVVYCVEEAAREREKQRLEEMRVYREMLPITGIQLGMDGVQMVYRRNK